MISVIWNDRAQFVICHGCGAIAGPRALVNIHEFLSAAKPFLREHRFHEPPQTEWPVKRASLGPSHSFPSHHRAPWEPMREPGEEG